MSLSNDLWQANQDLARACLHHPFVQGLADGSLARDRFAYYVGQDAFFLQAFARAYTLAGVKSPDWEGFCTLHALADGVLEELKLHAKYALQWGVDIMNVEPAAATRRYTDFVLATAWAYDTGVTVTALSPCMRLYAYLGQQLAQQNPPEHQYMDWIHTYGSQDIENLAQQLEQIIDAYTSDTPLVRKTYRYAMECERDFFQAALYRVAKDT
jgi:thiaminase/transcriptional activator TenA